MDNGLAAKSSAGDLASLNSAFHGMILKIIPSNQGTPQGPKPLWIS